MKITTAAEACTIGKVKREQRIEDLFEHVMRKIRYMAEFENSCVLIDTIHGGNSHANIPYVVGDDLVTFLTTHPEQVTRLTNMGYTVEQSIDEVINKSYTMDEEYMTRRGPYGWFGSRKTWRSVTKEITLTVRSFTITWECEECDEQ